MSPLGKSRGGTLEGERALEGAYRTVRCGGYGTASLRRSASFFFFRHCAYSEAIHSERKQFSRHHSIASSLTLLAMTRLPWRGEQNSGAKKKRAARTVRRAPSRDRKRGAPRGALSPCGPLAGEGCSVVQQQERVRAAGPQALTRYSLLNILRCPLPQGERAHQSAPRLR